MAMRVLVVSGLLAMGLAGAPRAAPPLDQAEFDCLMDAHSRVKVAAGAAGLIERVHVDRGDRVRAGQLLVELDSSVERANLDLARSRAANDQPIEAARARFERARRTAERLQRLKQINAGAVTESQLDEALTEAKVAGILIRDAEFAMESARLEARRSEASLAQRRVLSPLDGVVIERTMAAGEYRHDQASLMTLARIDPLHVEVFVPVAFFGQTALGARAEIRPEEPIGGRHIATVIVIDPVIDAASSTFGIRLRLPNPEYRLPAGLRCRIRFLPPEAETPGAPSRDP
ncbi:MAG: efflux RND transporter periplasmic adaptor subunit [Hyphomicrobiales bacterium]|uniref:efflux RND transporter periplasmic adaptor subunit n=1 Tax=Rhabdaerophilum calidifontis TaxID=2604328 RepID=UPI00123C0FE8|nr:efflux RND transporter periplasmic adaptor subunit [Rhabdaerophilum calidifontis]MCA1952534.1 efflux RND transporter periplasmic adaptor subunit [Hyphomicrobiales bacterium]MCA1999168.1 efflux RND transporter periplasmic adaptor subunit [Hyphomicrobiales bacterium]